jgi:hypothetical protein
LFSNIIIVNCNLNHKALGVTKVKRLLAGSYLAAQVGKGDLFAEPARSWIEKTEQVPSGYKILDGISQESGRT